MQIGDVRSGLLRACGVENGVAAGQQDSRRSAPALSLQGGAGGSHRFGMEQGMRETVDQRDEHGQGCAHQAAPPGSRSGARSAPGGHVSDDDPGTNQGARPYNPGDRLGGHRDRDSSKARTALASLALAVASWWRLDGNRHPAGNGHRRGRRARGRDRGRRRIGRPAVERRDAEAQAVDWEARADREARP